MSYFPRSLMPLTPKQDSSRATSTEGRITAGAYNKHDEELRAIEEFLGTLGSYPLLGVPRPTAFSFFDENVRRTTGISTGINTLIDDINWMVSPDGVASSSGYTASKDGKALTVNVPEQAFWTTLAKAPSSGDSIIEVASTAGFPSSGVISILNKVEMIVNSAVNSSNNGSTTSVEWIQYSGIQGNSFVGCVRAFMGTTAGIHSAGDSEPGCLKVQGADVCAAPWPGYGHSTWYKIAPLSLRGAFPYLKNFLQSHASTISFTDGASSTLLKAAASELGLLAQRADGSYFLESDDSGAQAAGELTADEALDLMDELIANGGAAADTVSQPSSPQVMVFAGRLSVMHSIASLIPVSGAPESIRIIQSPSGKVYGLIGEIAALPVQVIQSVMSCQTLFIPSPASATERFER